MLIALVGVLYLIDGQTIPGIDSSFNTWPRVVSIHDHSTGPKSVSVSGESRFWSGGGHSAEPQSVSVSGRFSQCSLGNRRNCVIDGDTIRYGGERIRLADIDTPETSNPKCGYEANLGRRATQRLVELMNQGTFEVVPAGDRDVDRYGRKLRVLQRNGQSLGDILINEGLARPWDGARRSWC